MRTLSTRYYIRCASVVFFMVILPARLWASDQQTCEVQGTSCANLVYQGFTYPFERPAGSYLYVNAGVYPYVTITDTLLGDSTVRLPDNNVIAAKTLLETMGLGHKVNGKLFPIIGYGSNPAPTQIARKFVARDFDDDVVVPVMKGYLKDYDVVWTPVFVDYGSMPATITPSPGSVAEVWVTWLDDKAKTIMDGTEHANPAARPLYVKTTLKGSDYEFDGPDPKDMTIYISCFGPLFIEGRTYAVSSIRTVGRTFLPATASEAIEAVLPILGWNGGVLSLLYSNIVSAEKRAERSALLEPYGTFPQIPRADGLEACRESRSGAEKPY